MDGYMPGMDHNHHSRPPATPEQLHRARVAVCARATDVDDARHLLRILGLIPQPEPAPAAPAPERRQGPWLDSDGLPKVCKRGHVYTAANTRWPANGRGTPVCRACDSQPARRARREARQ